MPGMAGPQALSWAEIEAWNRATNSGLNAWELETIRHLSRCYVSSLLAAKSKGCPPPVQTIEYRVTGDDIKQAMRSIGKRQSK